MGGLAGVLAAPLAAGAQQPAKVSRIGWLLTGSLEAPETRALLSAFRQGARERGYVEGQNLVTSLARPGGNITGLTFLGPELAPKRLELLKEALPKMSRLVGIWHPGSLSERTAKDMLSQTETAARTLGVHLELVGVRSPDEIDRAFSTMARQRPDAFVMFPSVMFFIERRRVIDLAERHRLPSIYVSREFVDIGGLFSYGASIPDLFRRTAVYVDKILKGAKPADLPVEQPSKFELVINLKTAKALGLTIPQSLVARADEAIQ